MRRILKTVGALALAGAVLAACSGTGSKDSSSGSSTKKLNLTYAVITHARPGDAFWDRVKTGAEKAGSDYGVKVNYSNNDDPAKQSQLIDSAVSQKVNGIVVSMANPQGLKASIEKAVAAGIPVVTINSGIDYWKAYGAITHIGQSETIAGTAVGEKLNSYGLKNVVCVIQEAGNIALEQRCSAATKAFSGKMTTIQVDGTSDPQVKATIQSKLLADKSVDGVLTLGGQYALDAVGAVKGAGSSAKVATFDLSEDVAEDVKDGKILFAVDQQPYVQGFLGVTALYLKSINGNDIGGGQPIYSGPEFITKDNAASVLKYAKNGTR